MAKETHYRISNEKLVPSWCQQAVKKISTTRSVVRKPREWALRTQININAVEELVLSQDDQPCTWLLLSCEVRLQPSSLLHFGHQTVQTSIQWITRSGGVAGLSLLEKNQGRWASPGAANRGVEPVRSSNQRWHCQSATQSLCARWWRALRTSTVTAELNKTTLFHQMFWQFTD